jgi:hypothetical protein
MAYEEASSMAVHFDVAGVIAEAAAYAAAIVAGDTKRAGVYLLGGSKTAMTAVLDALPSPLVGAEVVSLTVPDSGRSTTLTRYTGGGDSVLVLAVWVETANGLMIRDQRIAGV